MPPVMTVDNQSHSSSNPATTDSSPHARLKPEVVSDADRNFGIAMHLTPFACFLFPALILTPLVLWIIGKNRSDFVDDHGREVINFHLSMMIYILLTFWTIIIPIVIAVVWVISLIRGAISASNAEYFRYPITIRFF